ncbi:hypothetical protein FRB99_003850 [Tulasnella sp. 403]|nr:hypothetical protein FRB99_003850 [Tulasnella sp. 403]
MAPKRKNQTIYSSEVEDATGQRNGQSRTLPALLLSLTATPPAKELMLSKITFYDKPGKATPRIAMTMRPRTKQSLLTIHESFPSSGFHHSKKPIQYGTQQPHRDSAVLSPSSQPPTTGISAGPPAPLHTHSASQPVHDTTIHQQSQHRQSQHQHTRPQQQDDVSAGAENCHKPPPNLYQNPVTLEEHPPQSNDFEVPEHQLDEYGDDDVGAAADDDWDGDEDAEQGSVHDEAQGRGGEWQDYYSDQDGEQHTGERSPTALDLNEEREHNTSPPKRHCHACRTAKASDDASNQQPVAASRSAATRFPCPIYLLIQHTRYYVKAICAANDLYPCYECQVEIVHEGWSNAVQDVEENGNEEQEPELYKEVYWTYIAAKALVGEAYGLSKRKSAWKKNQEIYKHLIEEDKYTCVNMETGDGRWFQPLLYDLVQAMFFANKQGSLGIVYKDLFKPISLQTIALIYTAIRCAIDEYAKGKYVSHRFEQPNYEPVYCAHFLNLSHFATKSAAAARFLQQDLWKKSSGLAVAVSKSAVLSEAAHNKTVEDALCM